MPSVVIVGDRESGKTTFLGLLYATQVMSGSDLTDRVRFHAPAESLQAIALVFQQLMSGSFPDPVAKQEVRELSFQLGHRRSGLRGRWTTGASSTLRFALLRNPIEDTSRQLMGSSVIDESSTAIHESAAVAIVVDSTKLAGGGGSTTSQPNPKFDGAVDSFLTILQRLGNPERRTLLHPVFVFTKFDLVNPEVLRASNVTSTPPRVDAVRARAAYAEAILDINLPRTLARVRTRDPEGRRFAQPAYFMSWVRTEETRPGQPARIRLRRSEVAGWEPEYSHEEYRALMEHVADIALSSRE